MPNVYVPFPAPIIAAVEQVRSKHTRSVLSPSEKYNARAVSSHAVGWHAETDWGRSPSISAECRYPLTGNTLSAGNSLINIVRRRLLN